MSSSYARIYDAVEEFMKGPFWTADLIDAIVDHWLQLPSLKTPDMWDYHNCFEKVFGKPAHLMEGTRAFLSYTSMVDQRVDRWVQWLTVADEEYKEMATEGLLLQNAKPERMAKYMQLSERLALERDKALSEALMRRDWRTANALIQAKQGITYEKAEGLTVLHTALQYGAPKSLVESLLAYIGVQHGKVRNEAIYALFSAEDPRLFCDISTLRLLLARGALVARANLRIDVATLFRAFCAGRSDLVELALLHNYQHEVNENFSPYAQTMGVLRASLIAEGGNPQLLAQFLFLLMKYGGDPFRAERDRYDEKANFFQYGEKLRRERRWECPNYSDKVESGVRVCCIMLLLCSTRLPRFRQQSTPIHVLPIESFRHLREFLAPSFTGKRTRTPVMRVPRQVWVLECQITL